MSVNSPLGQTYTNLGESWRGSCYDYRAVYPNLQFKLVKIIGLTVNRLNVQPGPKKVTCFSVTLVVISQHLMSLLTVTEKPLLGFPLRGQ